MDTPYSDKVSFVAGVKNIFSKKESPFSGINGIYTNCGQCSGSYLLYNNNGFLLLDNGGKIII